MYIGVAALVAVLTVGFWLGIASPAQQVQAQSQEQGGVERTHDVTLQHLRQAMEIVQALYVEEVSQSDLIEAAIVGMLRDLDPHSIYLSPEAVESFAEGLSGNFGGLGIQIDLYQDVVRVIAPIDDTPAFRAGLKAGDLIVALDGEPVYGKSLNEAVSLMRGEIGTEISLRVVRDATGETFDVTIERAKIPDVSVLSRLEAGNVGFIRISNFTARTGEELVAVVEDLIGEAQTPLAGFVLDLRSNPGGVLASAVAVANTFLDTGDIVSTRKRDGNIDQTFVARRGDLIAGLPLVVLIDGGSASASEIVAAALQDNGRALIMGQRSFGKGSVQELYRLGPDSALKLTVARYYSPDGKAIQGVGVTPDIEVRPATLEYLDAEPAYREENLSQALSTEQGQEQADEARDEAGESPSQGLDALPELGEAVRPEFEARDRDGDGLVEQVIDYPLERAVDLIQALSLVKSLGG